MASWWHTDIRFERISSGKVKRLTGELKSLDYDFDNHPQDPDIVCVYSDGIRGRWRSPLVSVEELRGLLVRSKAVITHWEFEPRKCNDKDCSCHTLTNHGCVFYGYR